eukprot:CAMPEP_0118954708 /NCGR_PEP_ID=MMETSP1169-20130426/58737_1 /TAXON_ID=36882 /ORGANISM="Pyramimonas obovata, Strain CCMP722" /LENGTH=101 /DNA_ID=CAMNT_0006902387 /DNA_START=30 /DNA_END=332 /DNA_ORIENTATION=-
MSGKKRPLSSMAMFDDDQDQDASADVGPQESGASNSKGHSSRQYRGQRIETPSHPGGLNKDAVRAIAERGEDRRHGALHNTTRAERDREREHRDRRDDRRD